MDYLLHNSIASSIGGLLHHLALWQCFQHEVYAIYAIYEIYEIYQIHV